MPKAPKKNVSDQRRKGRRVNRSENQGPPFSSARVASSSSSPSSGIPLASNADPQPRRGNRSRKAKSKPPPLGSGPQPRHEAIAGEDGVKNICPYPACAKKLSSSGDYGRHFNHHHSNLGRWFVCLPCLSKGKVRLERSLSNLDLHMGSIHKGLLSCGACQTSFTHGKVAFEHRREVHHIPYPSDALFTWKSHLKRDLESVEDSDIQECLSQFYAMCPDRVVDLMRTARRPLRSREAFSKAGWPFLVVNLTFEMLCQRDVFNDLRTYQTALKHHGCIEELNSIEERWLSNSKLETLSVAASLSPRLPLPTTSSSHPPTQTSPSLLHVYSDPLTPSLTNTSESMSPVSSVTTLGTPFSPSPFAPHDMLYRSPTAGQHADCQHRSEFIYSAPATSFYDQTSVQQNYSPTYMHSLHQTESEELASSMRGPPLLFTASSMSHQTPGSSNGEGLRYLSTVPEYSGYTSKDYAGWSKSFRTMLCVDD